MPRATSAAADVIPKRLNRSIEDRVAPVAAAVFNLNIESAGKSSIKGPESGPGTADFPLRASMNERTSGESGGAMELGGRSPASSG
jgi:hypothetical protein